MPDIEPMDYDLLKYVSKHEPVDVEEALLAFPKTLAVEYRLQQLGKARYSETAHCYIPNSSYIIELSGEISADGYCEPTGKYKMTDYGHKFLQDYKKAQSKQKREQWVKSVWCPALVSLITAILTIYVLPLLLRFLK